MAGPVEELDQGRSRNEQRIELQLVAVSLLFAVLSLTALANWSLRQNRLTLDLSSRSAVLEDGALPGDVEETALV